MEEESNIPPKVSPFAILGLLLFIGFMLFLVIKSLFSAKATENKPEIKPADAGTENNGKPMVVPVVSEPISVPPVPENPTPAILTELVPLTKSPTQFPPLHKRKRINRKHMENIFRQGELTLTDAVEALKNLGFSKSAAYEALSANGQFSAWLQFAPDGMISWKG